MTTSCDALVVGAGGFLGGHLVRSLLLQGLSVRAVDIRPVDGWSRSFPDADNRCVDVSGLEAALAVTSGATTVYDLAAPPLSGHRADRMAAVLLDTHLLLAARDTGVDRFVFASSANEVTGGLAATAADDRCWRSLFTERMARHFAEDFDVQTRVGRLGPVYGPHASTDDASVVTVVTRLVAAAVATHRRTLDVPFAADTPAPGVYVDDAVLGLQLVTHGVDDCRPYDVVDPHPLTVAEVVDTTIRAAGATLDVRYAAVAPCTDPVGDPRPLRDAVDWQPDIRFPSVVRDVYAWTAGDVRTRLELPTDLTTWWARRRARNHPQVPVRGVGRHRYENTG